MVQRVMEALKARAVIGRSRSLWTERSVLWTIFLTVLFIIFTITYLGGWTVHSTLRCGNRPTEMFEMIVARNPCDVVVPGLERMSHGVDVTRLDMLHDYSVDNMDGYVKALFELSCDEGKSWVSPFDGKRYSVPDQLDSITALPSGIVYSEALLQYHTRAVRESMSAEAGISDSNGTFSLSLSYRDAHNTLTNTSRFVSQTKAFVSTVQMDFIPSRWLNVSLNRYARDYIDNVLPDKYEDDPGVYRTFFNSYGTHYFGTANFGGLFSIWFHIEDSLRQLETDKQIQVNAKATFLGILKAHGAYDGEVASVSVDFLQRSVSFTRYFGGMANIFDSEGFKHWWPTVAANPWLCSGDLIPVYNLVSGAKRAAMQIAYEVLLLKASLEESRRTLYAFLGKGFIGEGQAQGLLAQLESLFNQTRPSAKGCQELVDAIDNFVLVPDWFVATTYDISWDDGDCGHTEQNWIRITTTSPAFNIWPVTCAWSTSRFTLHPPKSAPSWFESQVSIKQGPLIFEWAHWGINIPPNAPGWLLNVKFCAQTYGFFCATPNQLTPPYHPPHNTIVWFQVLLPYTNQIAQQ